MTLEILTNSKKLYQCPRYKTCDQNFSGMGKGTCKHAKLHEYIKYSCNCDNCKDDHGATCIIV